MKYSERIDSLNAAALSPWVVTGTRARERWGSAAVRAALERNTLVKVSRDVYGPRLFASSLEVRGRAALLIADPEATGRATITGQAALFLAGVIDEAPRTITVALDRQHHVTRAPELTRYYRCTVAPQAWARGELRIAEPEWALLHAMRELGRSQRRDLALYVIGMRAVDPWLLTDILEGSPHAKGRRELREALALHGAGIHSPLEFRGLKEVLHGAEFARLKWQYTVRVGGERFRLDAYEPGTMLAIEFDGRRFHAGQGRWDADRRRDLILASAGIQTVRLTHAMVAQDASGCRELVRATMRARRRAAAA